MSGWFILTKRPKCRGHGRLHKFLVQNHRQKTTLMLVTKVNKLDWTNDFNCLLGNPLTPCLLPNSLPSLSALVLTIKTLS